MATNDVAGIYRANVGGGFSTQEIVIISRPVQLVLCKMTKREEGGVSFGRTEKLSGESAANGKREADWRRRRRGVIILAVMHNAETRKRKEEEVTRGIQKKKKSKQNRDPTIPQKKEKTGTGLTNFGPSHVGSSSHCSLIAS